MRNLLFMVIALLVTLTANAQIMSFSSTEIDYGILEKGANGVREFRFQNTGDAPLIITNAKQSCGCTVPVWPKEPILPGASAIIKVKYDTKREGAFTKHVTISSNSIEQSTQRLVIKGFIQKEAAPTPAKEANLFSQ